MTLGEQLDELRTNILRDRSDLIAGMSDRLWSDETLIKYIEDAEKRFARQTLILRDSTTAEIVQITLREGVKTYRAHSTVLAVISAQYDTDQYDLQRSGHGLVAQYQPPEFMALAPQQYDQYPPDRPAGYYTDETLIFSRQGTVTVSFFPVPGPDQEGKKVYLRVARLPNVKYSVNDLGRCSELPEDYQLDVLEWAAYRAQRGFDGDAGAPTVSDKHKIAFDEAVARAETEAKRKMFANIPFRYGANGFSGYQR